MIIDCTKLYNQDKCLYNILRGSSTTSVFTNQEVVTTPTQDMFMFLSISFLSGILIGETILLGNLFKKYFFDVKTRFLSSKNIEEEVEEDEDEEDDEDINDDENEVIIVRGVPGIGKTNYVYERENDTNRNYSICNYNEYFEKDGKYNFDGRDINKAEQVMFNKFLTSIKKEIPKIYVVGSFNEIWMYENYLTTAQLFNYNIKVVELECLNKEQLVMFNRRSKHKVPYTKSVKLFNNWEYDERSWIQRPYISCPSKKDTKLENSDINNKCLIDSDTETEDTSDGIRYSKFVIEERTNQEENHNELLTRYYNITKLDDIDSEEEDDVEEDVEEEDSIQKNEDNISIDS